MDPFMERYGLQSIELSDKPIFDGAFGSLREPLSDYTFANTFIWRSGLKLCWTLIEGHICVFANGTGDLTMLFPPIGEGETSRAIRRSFEIMDDYNAAVADRSHSRIEYASDELVCRLGKLGLASAPMGGDYIYETPKMIDLSGGVLKSKRQAKNRFLRDHEVRVEPLTRAHVHECIELLSAWRERGDARDEAGDPLAREAALLRARDTMATELALEHAEELGLTGMLLWADGRLVGFTLGEPLSPTQASIVIEKTDLSLYGSAQYIFSEFCRRHWSAYPECNVGDDWGIPSLRWTKESYRPVRILSKYVITKKPTPMVGWRAPEEGVEAVAVAGPRHMTGAGLPAAGDRIVIDMARLEDALPLTELEEAIFSPHERISKRQIRYLLRSGRAVVACARVGDAIVGSAILLTRRHRTHRSARLYSLAVAEAWRGRGIGQRLVERVLETAEEMGIRRCFLEVSQENEAARRLYERIGFVIVATLPHYYEEGRHAYRMLRIARAPVGEPPPLPRPLGLV